MFRTFTWASPDDAKKIAAVLSKFEEYCIPRENVPSVSSGSRTVDSVVGTTKDAAALALARFVHIVKRGIILLPSAQQKAKCLLSKSDSI